jgi:very-short-patch-repair endonuclease
MSQSATSYNKLSDQDKLEFLQNLYIKQNKSFADIAAVCGTYANKIRRDAIALQIPIRDKSAAQKNALNTGKHQHPTKGKERSQVEKNKIGMGVMKAWDGLDEQTLQNRKQKSKELWENLDEDTKQNMIRLANEAVRNTSKVGSKLEKFLLDQLLKDGYKVDFHKEQSLLTTKLQIDLFLPSMNTAIEIDGPSHFLPVWGEDALAKNISYDNKKEGLIIGKGLVLIRIKQSRDFSKTRASLIYQKLKTLLDEISVKFPINTRSFSIED